MRYIALLLIGYLIGTPLAAQRAIRPDYHINSVYEEREPTPSPDGKTLYFWRRENPANTGGVSDPGDIWISRLIGPHTWEQATQAAYPLNSMGQDFVCQLSPRQDTLWLCQTPLGVKHAGLMYCVRQRNGNWSVPVAAHIRGIQYEGRYKDFFITRCRILILTNEGPNSRGGSDLYVCFPRNDTAWSAPINLGPVINTFGDEDAPCISPDGYTLFFSSNGRGGAGDHDIFMTRRLDDSWQNWTQPVNLGPPVNTPGMDFDFYLGADGKTAWWGTDQKTYGANDLYYMDLSSCKLVVYPEGDQTGCQGQEITLQAGFTLGKIISYQWLLDGRPLPGANARTLTVREPGAYRLIRVKDGCADTSRVQQVRFVTPPVAGIDQETAVLCLEDSTRLVAISQGRSFYQWQLNGLDIPQATQYAYWARTPGKYTVRVSNGSCATISDPVDMRRFGQPVIYTPADTLRGDLPALPRWLWTNKLPKARGPVYFRDVAISASGHPFVLTTQERGDKYVDQVAGFFAEGLYRFALPETRREDLKPGLMVSDADGNLIVASEEQLLAKFHPDGRPMWSKPDPVRALDGVATDPLGFIYTLGRFTDTLVIGNRILEAPNRGGLFIAKHSPRGELLWVNTYPVDGDSDEFGNAIHTDCNGNLYIAGGFNLIANFTTEILRAGVTGENYFLVKFSPEGQLLWSRTFNTAKTRIRTQDVHTDCEGNTFLALNRELWRIGPDGGTRWHDKLLEPAGAFTFAHRIHSTGGDLYVAGITDKGDIYLTKLNRINNQVIIWQSRSADNNPAALPVLTADDEGHIYLAGVCSGNSFQGVQFDLTSGSDLFIMKYGPPDLSISREPVSLCQQTSVTLMTRELSGLRYQWIRNGKDILGATQSWYEARSTGTYQVRAFSGGCDRLSEPVVVAGCGEAPPMVTASPAAVEPVQEPEFVRPPEPPRDLKLDPNSRPRELRGRKVTSQAEITVSGPHPTIYVWDHASADRDTISLNINGEWALERHGLTNRRQQVNYTLKPGLNYIMLYAHNLGSIPPNTASITVEDARGPHTLQLRSTLRDCGMLVVRVE
ncbi:MAG: hypothetical protein SF053_20580 [Bacteroidia bacterium]|nr:hypothetical protein [Bacteroidia bacterium]